jgi:hypothetical protein
VELFARTQYIRERIVAQAFTEAGFEHASSPASAS